MTPRLRCPACGANGTPIARLVGYPDPEGHAALARGEAEIAAGCTDADIGPIMPFRCRRCRRLLADPGDPPAALAALALADPEPQGAARAGLYGRVDGRGLVLVTPLLPPASQTFLLAGDARSLLRGARRPMLVLRVEGVAARFAAGRALRGALQLTDPIVVSDDDQSAARCGDRLFRLTTRPPRGP